MKRGVSYLQLLKEAICEYDAKSLDYKGPMTDSPLTFDGDGELETHKDASSILERYYFNENKEKLVEQEDEPGPENPVDADEDEDAEDPNEIVTGEEGDDVDDTMEDLEDELLDEADDLEEDYEPGDEDIVAKDEPLEDEKAAPVNNEMVALENTIIEKLIQEMEEEEKADGGEAGTDLADEKDVDKIIEDLELEDEDLDSKDSDDDDLDVDKEVASEGEGMGPIRVKAAREIEEAFKIFSEQIEDDDKKEDEDKEDLEEDEDLNIDDDDEKDKDLEEDFDLI